MTTVAFTEVPQTWLAWAIDLPDAEMIDPVWALAVAVAAGIFIALMLGWVVCRIFFPIAGEPRVDVYANPFGDVVICPPNMRRPYPQYPNDPLVARFESAGAALRTDANGGRDCNPLDPAAVRTSHFYAKRARP